MSSLMRVMDQLLRLSSTPRKSATSSSSRESAASSSYRNPATFSSYRKPASKPAEQSPQGSQRSQVERDSFNNARQTVASTISQKESASGIALSKLRAQELKDTKEREAKEAAALKAGQEYQRKYADKQKAARELQEERGLPGKVEVRQLSWDEYNALGADDRAAVDFNTALQEASDLDRQGALSRKGQDSAALRGYDAARSQLFGSGNNDGDIYAPNTMALLSSLDFKDEGGDLDDYLSMRAGVELAEQRIHPEEEWTFQTKETKTPDRFWALPKAAQTRLTQVLQEGQDLLSASRSRAIEWGSLASAATDGATTGFNPDSEKGQIYNHIFDMSASLINDVDEEGNETPFSLQDSLDATFSDPLIAQYGASRDEYMNYAQMRLRLLMDDNGRSPDVNYLPINQIAQRYGYGVSNG